jgi:phosphoglycolate phosphatase-like HAD superfamily hydrolase
MVGKQQTRAVFWDIDGTLLVTGRAGIVAWERALAAIVPGATFPAVRPDGLTDHQIAAWLLHASGATASTVEIDALVSRYEAALPDTLPLRTGRVLDNVRQILAWLAAERPHVLSWLVTGNTRHGAAAKLAHYGLADSFGRQGGAMAGGTLRGSFSERVEPRATIVSRALSTARESMPDLQSHEALVIGDTPHDIDGARAIGVPALVVATNVHSLDELQAAHPWHALPALPVPAEFARLLDATEFL